MKKKTQYTNNKQNRMKKACMNYLKNKIGKDLPYIYSAIALAMWNLVDGDEEEKHDSIIELINTSSLIWNDILENGKDVIEECYKTTGVDIRKSVE